MQQVAPNKQKRDLSLPRKLLRLHPAWITLLLFVLLVSAKVLRELGAQWQAAFRDAIRGAVAVQQQFQPPPTGQNDSYLAMCIAVRDEHCDIREWVLHHASLGAAKFYIFDTQSEQPMAPVLDDLISSGLVEYHYVTNTTEELHLKQPGPGRSYNWQAGVYPLCLQRYGARHEWMAFIDADEFIVLQDGTPSLPDLLRPFQQDDYGGLALHWRFFSDGGHLLRPPGGVLASYTACCDVYGSRTVKSIVRPAAVESMQTVHSFNYRGGKYAVNTAGRRVDSSKLKGEASYKGAVLHHYITKSLFDFDTKMQRRGGAGSQKNLTHFLDWHARCTATCRHAVGAGEQLWRRHNLTRNVPRRCLPGYLPRGGGDAQR